ncbi:MAG TPA: hypothetical protein VK502_01020 [Candidatus Saccharimonadales bacterium]|nr:hypothetical protein [Candidatus Saccharimonadales bacterium]
MNNQRDKYDSYQLFANVLEQKGYSVDVVKGHPSSVTYTSPSGAVWKTNPVRLTYPFNTEEVHDISLHKNKAYDLADSIGFPIPHTVHLINSNDDKMQSRILETFGKVIVKPADSAESRGLTIDIDSSLKLQKALTYARSVSSSVLIQEQITGKEIRFTVVRGKVVAALLRKMAHVVGDGTSTIAELIQYENEARKQLRFTYLTYPQLDVTIVGRLQFESKEVPPMGEVIKLSISPKIREGASIYDVLPQVDESYIALVEKLVSKLDAGFVVVDVFCEAYEEPARIGNYWLIEFNTVPALKLYYACRDGKQFDIVDSLAGAIDQWLHDGAEIQPQTLLDA